MKPLTYLVDIDRPDALACYRDGLFTLARRVSHCSSIDVGATAAAKPSLGYGHSRAPTVKSWPALSFWTRIQRWAWRQAYAGVFVVTVAGRVTRALWGGALSMLLVLGHASAFARTLRSASARPMVVVGAEDDAAPWSYADGSGYVNDVVRAAFARSGWETELKVIPYARCKQLVVAGRLLACFSASKTPELEAQLLYPRWPVFSASNLLIARADASFSGCDTRLWPTPLKVGRVVGYEYRATVEALLGSGRMVADDAISEVSNLRKLQAGRIDAALVNVDAVKRLEFVAAQAQTNHAFKTICDFGSEDAYIVFSRKHPTAQLALQAFESGYEALRNEGRIAALQQMWRARLFDGVKAKTH